jgi:hypothetical protein
MARNHCPARPCSTIKRRCASRRSCNSQTHSTDAASRLCRQHSCKAYSVKTGKCDPKSVKRCLFCPVAATVVIIPPLKGA